MDTVTRGYQIARRAYKLGGMDAVRKVEAAALKAGRKQVGRGIEACRLLKLPR